METEEPRDNKIAKNKEAEFDRQKRIKRASSDESRSRKWKRLKLFKKRTSTLSRSPLEQASSEDSSRSRGGGRKPIKNLRKDARSPLRERIDRDRGKKHSGDRRSNTSARSPHNSTKKDGRDREREQVFYNFLGEDRSVVEITIPEVAPPSNKKIPLSPQTYIDEAVAALDRGNGSLSAECLSRAGALQLKNFCIKNGFDTFSHEGNNGVVFFLVSKFYGEEIAEDICATWTVLSDCRPNFCVFSTEVHVIREYLKSAKLLCDSIFSLYNRVPIKYEDVVRDREYLMEEIVEVRYPEKVNEYELANEVIAIRYDKVDVHNMSEFFKQLAVMTTNVYLSITQTIELNDKKKTFDVKVRGREEVLVVLDGSFKLTFKFKTELMGTSCNQGDYIKIRKNVWYQMEVKDYTKIIRFVEKKY
uniref:Uncharacterized protein n=2 Tax=Meloidogyne TaxID=189290 RepID=A0A6V7U5M2_MELEN|nr:unnamed protein product [Meloidogyne enterolobii]